MIRPALFLGSIMLIGLLSAASGGCSSSDAAPVRECVPGKIYFCKCADLTDGEKVCGPDGERYAACMRSSVDNVECTGGELVPPRDAGTTTEPGTTDIVVSDRRQCPGKSIPLELGKSLALEGDTADAAAKQVGAGPCAAADGNEHVYAVTPKQSGKLEATLEGLDDVTLYVRSGSCAGTEEVACAEGAGPAKPEKVTFEATAGTTYWLFADAKKGSLGKYRLALDLSPAGRCGDGKLQPGEACDDGNDVDGDGCSPTCLPSGDDVSKGACPGVAVNVWDTPVTFTGSTKEMAKQFQYAGADCGPSYVTGVDRVYAVTAQKAGTMTVTTSASDFDHVIYARAESCTTATHIACGDTVPRSTAGERIAFPVASGKTYFVIVDGWLTGRGTFTMTIGIQ